MHCPARHPCALCGPDSASPGRLGPRPPASACTWRGAGGPRTRRSPPGSCVTSARRSAPAAGGAQSLSEGRQHYPALVHRPSGTHKMEPPLGSLAPWNNRSPRPPPPAPLFTPPSRHPSGSPGGDGNVLWIVLAILDGHSDLAGGGARPFGGVLALVFPGWRWKRLGLGCGRRRLTLASWGPHRGGPGPGVCVCPGPRPWILPLGSGHRRSAVMSASTSTCTSRNCSFEQLTA